MYKFGGVQRNLEIQPWREVLAGFILQCPDIVYSLNGVRPWQLVNDKNRCWYAILPAETRIAFCRQIGARNVFHPQDGTIRHRSDDHVVEFRRVYQPALDI